MDISVILCTYNRCSSLKKALESVAASRMPDSVSWEVLVVDNNSSDKTRDLVEEMKRLHPGRLRYLFEKKQGKSHALNCGIAHASGELLTFVDDDVEVDPHWLQNLTRNLAVSTWSGVGGRILPEHGFVPPDWMETKERYALAPLAVFDRGQEACELRESPFGTNMAFRKQMFAKYGGFRIDLGPQPGSEIRNEDTEFGSRLLDHGERFWYEPSAVVYHSVPPERVHPKYFLAWWFDKARADIRQDGIPKDTKLYLGGIPIYLFRRLIVWSLRWMGAINPRQRFSNKLKVWGVVATIKECRRQVRNASHRKH